MTFISGKFFILLLLTFTFYYISSSEKRWIVLLISSMVFYSFSGVFISLFIILTTFIAYAAAIRIDQIYNKRPVNSNSSDMTIDEKKKRQILIKRKAKMILLLSVGLILLLLVFFKLEDKIYDVLASVFHLELTGFLRIAVPLGISYYTFSLIGYIANVYWRKEKAENNFFKLLLFAVYFPKILQGPIVNHKNIAGQLTAGNQLDYHAVCFGLQLIVYGLFKKLVIADRLAIFVNNVFDINTYMNKSGLIFVIGALFASMQLYCDFSGCMDIAEGISELFGIKMEKNFDHPFFAKSAAEFWRRWHITLGVWFKEYIYMPLVVSPILMKAAQKLKARFGSRVMKSFMVIVPTAIVWLLTGLWHGTGYNYIAWGIYWGAMIIISNVFAPEIKRITKLLHINTSAGSWRIFQMIRTYCLFSFGRLITLPGHLRTTMDIVKSIFRKFDIWILFDGSLYNYGLNSKNLTLTLLACFTVWSVSMLQEHGSVRQRIADSNIVIRWGIYYIAVFSVIIFGLYGTGYSAVQFTYMNY